MPTSQSVSPVPPLHLLTALHLLLPPPQILIDAPLNIWTKRFFVLRRPYLHIYTSNSEKVSLLVINLDADSGGLVSVTSSPEVEHLLGRKYCFTIFTKTNSYILQGTGEKEVGGWVGTLVPSAS